MSEPHPPDTEPVRLQSGAPVPWAGDPASGPAPDASIWRAATMDGLIDAIESGRIYGWAWDRRDPDHRVQIDVYHAGQLLETIGADRFRADLTGLNQLAGLSEDGDGKHAFAWDIPATLRHAHPAAFHLCFHGTSVPLGRSVRVAQAEAVASDPDQTVNSIVLALAQRITGIEQTVTQAMQLGLLLQHELQKGNTPERLLPHLGKGFQVWAGKIAGHIDNRLGERTASLHEGLGETARATAAAIAQMEGFLVRTDEALKRMVRQDDLAGLHAKMQKTLWVVVGAAFAAGVLGAGVAAWLLGRAASLSGA
ncbi:hypothetical protein [Azospirillum sp. sgz301742]